jgi:hypothetical protein
MATTRFIDHLLEGDHASRPAAGDVPEGTLYSCSDHGLIYQSDGSSWSTWANLGAIADITDIPTAETDTDLVLRPDGAGGVEWAAGGGGGGEFIQRDEVTRTAGDLSTTSTAWVDATSLTITMTTGARRCLVIVSLVLKQATINANAMVDVAVDGTRLGQDYGLQGVGGPANVTAPISIVRLTPVLTAASHTIKVQWRVDAGTGTLFASTSVWPATITVLETTLTS